MLSGLTNERCCRSKKCLNNIMKSSLKVTTRTNEDGSLRPVIELRCVRSDDARDSLLDSFKLGFGYEHSLLVWEREGFNVLEAPVAIGESRECEVFTISNFKPTSRILLLDLTEIAKEAENSITAESRSAFYDKLMKLLKEHNIPTSYNGAKWSLGWPNTATM